MFIGGRYNVIIYSPNTIRTTAPFFLKIILKIILKIRYQRKEYKMAVLPSFKDKSYYELSIIQCKAIISLKKSFDRLKVLVIVLFLAIITSSVGLYLGFKDFQKNVAPEIESKYQIPVISMKKM